MQNGVVISDLHMFARRSGAHRVLEKLYREMERADIAVLNGDIFDFRWTTLPTVSQTVEEAVGWLTKIARRHPHCQIHFVAGNHDCHRTFLETLHRRCRDVENLHAHEHHLCLADRLFLHGDVMHHARRPDALETYRATWIYPRRKGAHLSLAYDIANNMHLPHVVQRMAFTPERTARRVLVHMASFMPETLRKVNHVYLGHTHQPFTGYVYQGVTFHNTGCAVKRMEFNPLRFQVPRSRPEEVPAWETPALASGF
ncbi:MAG: metallophosphoesterase [Pseudomonadota bacterium]